MEARLCRETGCPPLIARLLVNRGVLTPTEAGRFFAGSADDLYDPRRMKSLDEAVGLVRRALENETKILIYGDYDVDGMTATALMVKVLQYLGGRVAYQIPERMAGYGLHADAVRRAAADGYGLLITVDTGIAAPAEIELACALGLDVVITDHHEPNGVLPPVPALNPKQKDCAYPFKHLAGVGVAYKLALALCPDLPPALADELLGLVCLGTVADVVPLRGENRVLVSRGLGLVPLNPGLGAVLEAAGIRREPTIRDLTFVLSPRLNAAGRVGSSRRGVDLLLAGAAEAPAIAAELGSLNTHRRHLEDEITAQVLAEIAAWQKTPHFPVFRGEGWHFGVLGILASRFAERLGRPVAFVGLEGDRARGSARGIPGLNLFEIFKAYESYFSDFGGHEQAVGFSMAAAAVPEFTTRLNDHVAHVAKSAAHVVEIDAVVSIADLNLNIMEQIEKMQPWGCENPEPRLLLRGVTLRECRPVGRDGAHLKLVVVDQGGAMTRGIAFRAAEQMEKMTASRRLDLVFAPIINEWNGRRSTEIRLADWRPAGAAGQTPSAPPAACPAGSRALTISRGKAVLPAALERAFAGRVAAGGAAPLARWIMDHRDRRGRAEILRPFVVSGQQVLVVVGNPRECVDIWAYLTHRYRSGNAEISFVHPLLDDEYRERCRRRYASGETRVLIGTPEVLAGHPGDTVFVWGLPHTMREWEALRALGSRLVLAYNSRDLKRNWRVLKSLAPNRKTIISVFQLARKAGGPVSAAALHQTLARAGYSGVQHWTVRTACRVLGELGLAEELGEDRIRLVPARDKRLLVDSVTFKRVHAVKKELYQLQRFFLTAPGGALASRLGCDIMAPGGR